MSQVCIELMKGLFTLSAVGLGSLIGLRVYFRQKEYELVKQRYLEGAVDVVAAQLEASLGVVSHNWARSQQLCKSFRDTGASFDLSELKRGFLELDASKFQQVAHHRIGSLLNSQVVWEIFQAAMAYASSANAVISQEIPEAIRLRCVTDKIAQDHKTMASTMADDLRELHGESFKYDVLLNELNSLGRMLEAEKLNLKAVGEFHKRSEVKLLIDRLSTAFPREQESHVGNTGTPYQFVPASEK
jgi:hypothetical protein